MHTPRRRFPPAPSHAKAVVLFAHPSKDSLSFALAQAWIRGAQGLDVERVVLADLDFDPVLHHGYRQDQPLEPDLQRVRQAIAEAAHLVVAYPVWWSGTPALLKGLFDRLLLPGWAFAMKDGRPVGGLAGRSARTLLTMDAPIWYDRVVNRGAARVQVAKGTLKFCGFSPVKESAFGGVGDLDAAGREDLLRQVELAGRKDAARVLRRFPAARGAIAAAPSEPSCPPSGS